MNGATKFEDFSVPSLVETRADLLVSAWLDRKLPPRNYLLGEILCTTSRWIIYGETGIGRTLFSVDLAGSVASGNSFLSWKGSGRSARVMYFDGEMPAETFKERMELIGQRYGSALTLYGYNRDILEDGDMPPLNTPEGEAWLWREIDAIKPDLIVFNSIMCLLTGSMSEEESWAPVKALVRKISSRRVAQVWLHHTGHDISKGFGTKTREWEMDTVVSLTRAEDDKSLSMEFRKARLRTPENREQFAPRLVRCDKDGWTEIGQLTVSKGRQISEGASIKHAVLSAYDRLADNVPASTGLNGAPVRKVSVETLRNEVRSRGFLDVNEKGQITPTSRTLFRRAKTALIESRKLVEMDSLLWRP